MSVARRIKRFDEVYMEQQRGSLLTETRDFNDPAPEAADYAANHVFGYNRGLLCRDFAHDSEMFQRYKDGEVLLIALSCEGGRESRDAVRQALGFTRADKRLYTELKTRDDRMKTIRVALGEDEPIVEQEGRPREDLFIKFIKWGLGRRRER